MADEQIKPTVPNSATVVINPTDVTTINVNSIDPVYTSAPTIHAEAAKVETSALDLKDHISQSIALAALSAGQAVRDEERRLKLLGVKVVGPFGRFWRACKAAGVAFLMTLHAQS